MEAYKAKNYGLGELDVINNIAKKYYHYQFHVDIVL